MIFGLLGFYEGLQIITAQATLTCASLQEQWQTVREKKWHCHPRSNLCQICVNVPKTLLPPFASLTAQRQGLTQL